MLEHLLQVLISVVEAGLVILIFLLLVVFGRLLRKSVRQSQGRKRQRG